ncbi:MAG: hypothetical protein AAGE98_01740 [Actinomycetota bacterium]
MNRWMTALLTAALMVASSCGGGDDDDTPAEPTTTTGPTTTLSPEDLSDAYDETFDGTSANDTTVVGEALLDIKRDEIRAAADAGDVETLEALLEESETWEDVVSEPSANFYSTVRNLRLRIEEAIAENR